MTPTRSRAALLLAALLFLGASCGGGEGGEVDEQAAMRASPAWPVFQTALGHAAAGRREQAELEFAKALEADSSQPMFFAERGWNLALLSRYRTATGVFDQGVELHPDHPELALRRGMTLLQAGQLYAAVKELRRTSELAPENDKALYWLARALYDRSVLFLGATTIDQKMLDESISAYERAVVLNPDNAELRYQAGIAYERKHDTEKALEHYEAAVRADPGHAPSHRSCGAIYLRQGDHDLALKALLRAGELAPEDGETHYQLGQFLEAKENWEQALLAYDKALFHRHGYSEAWFRKGNVLLRLGRDDEAAEAQRRFEEWTAAKKDLDGHRLTAMATPDDPQAHFTVGASLMTFWRFDEALVSFQRTIELAPGAPHVHVRASQAYQQLGNLDMALRQAETAREIAPEEPAVLFSVARVRLARGELARRS
ncbi:MAG: tetratricopeptide repeat protein [Planctomycetota bacterium]|nr:tetratricopeptide repeat protein [Planctomycetota bacterium]